MKYNNPVSSEFFCADPTSVEYNGRLYLIGTNDHEQFEVKGFDSIISVDPFTTNLAAVTE